MRALTPLEPPMGPFVGGLNQVADSHLLPANTATDAINCNLHAGALRPIDGPGTYQGLGMASPSSAFSGVSDAGTTWAFLPNNFALWVGALKKQHGCLDTLGLGYVTDIRSGGTVMPPRILKSGTSYAMGVIAPTTLTLTTNGGSGGSASYAVTFVSVDGLESNPYPVLSAAPVGCTQYVGSVWAIPLGASGRVGSRKIYRTSGNDPSGELYFINEVAGNVITSFTDTGYALVATVRLNWSPGGAIEDDVTTYDHSPWDGAMVISDYIHGANPGAAAVGSGVFFGTNADGYEVRWSPSGSPQYCPTDVQNRQPMPEQVQALRTHGYQTLAFMPNSIWSFSGVADYAMNRARTDAERGVRLGCGQTVRRCPWGVLFLSTEGVALYSDNAAPVITQNILDSRLLATLTINGATFYGGAYYLFHSTGTIILDMRDFPGQLRVFKSDQVIRCGWVNPYSLADTSYAPGHYVMLDNEQGAVAGQGAVRLWSLTEAIAGAVPLAVTWTTPKLTWGEPTRLKTWHKVRFVGTGAVTVSVYRDDETTPRVVKAIPDLSKRGYFYLGRGLTGKSLRITITSTAGATFSLTRLEPEGDLRDGT